MNAATTRQTRRIPLATLPASDTGVMPVSQAKGTPYLTFRAAGATYALGIVSTRSIRPLGPILAVEGMPDVVRNVMEVDGQAVPIVDLGAQMGWPMARSGLRSRVVVVSLTHEGRTFDVGVIIDGVVDVHALDVDMHVLPTPGGNMQSEFMEAVARRHDCYVMVMHLQQVLSPEEMDDLAEASQALRFVAQH